MRVVKNKGALIALLYIYDHPYDYPLDKQKLMKHLQLHVGKKKAEEIVREMKGIYHPKAAVRLLLTKIDVSPADWLVFRLEERHLENGIVEKVTKIWKFPAFEELEKWLWENKHLFAFGVGQSLLDHLRRQDKTVEVWERKVGEREGEFYVIARLYRKLAGGEAQ